MRALLSHALTALMDDVRTAFLSSGHKHSLQVDLAPGLPRVMADRFRMIQVLGNLLTNTARRSSASRQSAVICSPTMIVMLQPLTSMPVQSILCVCNSMQGQIEESQVRKGDNDNDPFPIVEKAKSYRFACQAK